MPGGASSRRCPADELDREIKRGPGGLRDIEFAVQLLQLVHGRADESLRSPSTLDALRALTAGGYVGRADGEALDRAYRFLRTVEHRLQLQKLRRTHTVPADDGRAALARRGAGLPGRRPGPGRRTGGRRGRLPRRLGTPRHRGAPAARQAALPAAAQAVARVPGDELRLTPDAAGRRLEVLGFADPPAALRHIQALTGGVSRSAAIQRQLLPAMLSEFADAPEPDRGLLAYRQVSERLGASPWYLRLLRDEGPVALRLAVPARAVPLRHRPAAARPRGAAPAGRRRRAGAPAAAQPDRGIPAAAARHADPVTAVNAVRALRRRELFRVACRRPARAAAGAGRRRGRRGVGQPGQRARRRSRAGRHHRRDARRGAGGDQPPPGCRLAIIGMGRLGGYETSYSSDADVLFVYEPRARAGRGRRLRGGPRGRRGAAPAAVRTGARAAAGRRRRPAPGGAAGAAGPQPRRVPGVLRQVVAGVGGAGAAARPVRRRRPPNSASGSWPWPTGVRYPPAAWSASR